MRSLVTGLALVFASLLPAFAAPDVDTLAGKRVMILGDSITQDGKYVSDLSYYLFKLYPAKDFDWISVGLGSETASGLSEAAHPFPRPCVHERLGRALAKVKPEVVVACYGMNDGIYHPQSPDRFQAYQTGIAKLATDSQAAGVKQVVLITPPIFDVRKYVGRTAKPEGPFSFIHPFAEYDKVLQDYSAWILSIRKDGISSIGIHTPMMEYQAERNRKDPAFRLTADGIHPTPLGHLFMARAILKGLGVTLPDVDLNAELARLQADPLFLAVDKYRTLRSKNWLPYIGYERHGHFAQEDIAACETAAAQLLTEINRLRR